MSMEFTRTIRPERKFRIHQWIDTTTFEPLFGVQHNTAHGKWAHVVVNDTPLLFKTKDEANERIKLWSNPVQDARGLRAHAA